MSGTQQHKESAWAPLTLCYGGMMCVAIGSNLAPVFLTTFKETFGGPAGLTDEQLGRVAAVIFAGFVAGILGGGPLADRWGAKPLAVLGAVLTVAGLALLTAARVYGALLAASAVLGLGAGVLDMILSPIVAAIEPERRTAALNWLHAFYCIGAVLTVLAGSAALHFGISWRILALALIACPAAIAAGFTPLRLPPLVHRDASRVAVRELLHAPAFLAGLAVVALAGASEQGVAQWLPAYVERVLGYTKAQAAMALAGFSVAMIVGRVLAALAARRVRAVPLLRGACVLLVLLIVAGTGAPQRDLACAACVLCGLAVSCLWPTTLGLTADRFPHGGASMFALLAAAGNAGCFVMPWALGIIAEHSGLALGMALVACCPAGIIVLLAAYGRHMHGKDGASRQSPA
ncbi:MAG: MFS transporter [Candidatus Hydrogenedentes bacterium]|nr:MFS transporter [Candidatus Hydrogenedentota bacterium]